jgi:hypothetical protein
VDDGQANKLTQDESTVSPDVPRKGISYAELKICELLANVGVAGVLATIMVAMILLIAYFRTRG